MKKLIWGVVIVVVVAGLLAIFGNQQSASGPIKIGVIAPLTGDAAVYGEPFHKMVQLAAEEINKDGVGGRQFAFIFEDGKCNGKDSVNAMQKLVNVDKVQVVIGGFCSSESLAAVPIAEANKVALFSPGSSSPDLTGRSHYFFRDYPSDASQGKVLAELSYNVKKWKKIAFIQEQLDYPLGVFKAFTATFEGLGGKVVKEEFPNNTTDFRSFLAKLRAQNADALFVDTQTPAAAERIFKQIQELRWKPKILISDAVSGDPETMKRNATILEGAFAAEFGVDPNNQKFQHMLSSYQKRYGTPTPYESYAQTVYDSVYVVRDGIAAVGYDGEKLAAWSRTIKDWPGASGLVTIGADGDRVSGHVPKVIHNGKVELLK